MDDFSADSQYYKYYHEGGFDSQLNSSAEATETFLKCGYYVTEVKTQKVRKRFSSYVLT